MSSDDITTVTTAPASATADPSATTADPGDTTADPGDTTADPGDTTADPGDTTADPAAPSLTPVSYLILGLVSNGATTPYEFKQRVANSVGYFWSFPHSQFYSEPPRLVALGLLEETREETGRRRRQYTITAAGRAALDAWLREPTREQPQVRDTGLLKLFFATGLSAEEIAALARAQASAHAERLALYEAMDLHLRPEKHAAQRATLRMGLLFERAFVEFWNEIATDPPQPPPRSGPEQAGG